MVAGEGDLLSIGRDGVHILSAEIERGHIVVAGRDVLGGSTLGWNYKQMAAFAFIPVRPVTIEKMLRDVRLHLVFFFFFIIRN